MKKFGEKFKEFDILEIKEAEIIDSENPPSEPIRPYDFNTDSIGYDSETIYDLERDLDDPILGIAPTANVYKIPSNQKDLSNYIKRDLSKFNFFIVELGLNVMLGREYKVPKLRLNINFKCNTDDKTDVRAVDLAPNDQFKEIKIVSGKIYLGINEFLNFIPSISSELLSNFIKIDINPIKFSWKIKRCMIDTSGKKNYKVYWKIYETDTVQGFNPMLILKARKNVSEITAKAEGTYIQKKGILTRNIKTLPSKSINIWPT